MAACLAQAATAARADGPADVALEWTAGPGAASCRHADALRRAVAGELRRNRLVDPPSADAVVHGRSERLGPTAWRATIVLFDRSRTELGRRELTREGDDCRALDEALVVVVAMMVDAAVTAPRSDPEPPPGPPPPSPTRRWTVAVAAAAQAELGRLPGHAAGLELALQIAPPALVPIELALATWTEASTTTAAGGSTFRFASAAVLACPLRRRTGRLALAPCGGVQVGAIASRGFGFLDNRRQRALVVDARAELRAELALSPTWFARLGLGVWAPLLRPRFSYQTDTGALETLYQPAIAAGVAQIGLGARFR